MRQLPNQPFRHNAKPYLTAAQMRPGPCRSPSRRPPGYLENNRFCGEPQENDRFFGSPHTARRRSDNWKMINFAVSHTQPAVHPDIWKMIDSAVSRKNDRFFGRPHTACRHPDIWKIINFAQAATARRPGIPAKMPFCA